MVSAQSGVTAYVVETGIMRAARHKRLVREGKASLWFPYRSLDKTCEHAGVP